MVHLHPGFFFIFSQYQRFLIATDWHLRYFLFEFGLLVIVAQKWIVLPFPPVNINRIVLHGTPNLSNGLT